MKKACHQCHMKRANMFPLVRHVDGSIEYICKLCWIRLHMVDFMKDPKDKQS